MPSKIGVPRPTPPSPISLHHRWSQSCQQTSSPPSSEVHVNLFVFAAKNFLRVAPILSWRLLVCCNLFQTSSFPQGSCWQSQKKVKLRQWISSQTLHCRQWASLRSPFYAKLQHESSKNWKYLNNLKLFLICVWIKVSHFLMSQSSSLNANLNR